VREGLHAKKWWLSEHLFTWFVVNENTDIRHPVTRRGNPRASFDENVDTLQALQQNGQLQLELAVIFLTHVPFLKATIDVVYVRAIVGCQIFFHGYQGLQHRTLRL
jgi:hypothetical protein